MVMESMSSWWTANHSLCFWKNKCTRQIDWRFSFFCIHQDFDVKAWKCEPGAWFLQCLIPMVISFCLDWEAKVFCCSGEQIKWDTSRGGLPTYQMLICTAHACLMPKLACSWQHASFRAGSEPERNKFHGWIGYIPFQIPGAHAYAGALCCTAQGGGCLHCWAWRTHDVELGNVMSSSVWESKTKCHHHPVIDKRDYTSTSACIDGVLVLCLLSVDALNRWRSHHPLGHGKQTKASTKQSLHSLLATKTVGLLVLD